MTKKSARMNGYRLQLLHVSFKAPGKQGYVLEVSCTGLLSKYACTSIWPVVSYLVTKSVARGF